MSSRPDIDGTTIGALDLSATTDWQDLTSASFTNASTNAACAAGLVFSRLVVVNPSTTETLYLQLRSATGTDTLVNRLRVSPGGSFTIPVYGARVTTIAAKASGAFTAYLSAWFFDN